MADLGVLLEAEAALARAGGEAKVGEGGGDDMEVRGLLGRGVGAFAAGVSGGIGEEGQDLGDFEKVTGPAMDEEERNSILLVGGALVQKVYVQGLETGNLDHRVVVGQLVDLGFLFTPVKTVLPVRREPLDVRQRGAIIPAGAVEFVGEVGVFELLVQ